MKPESKQLKKVLDKLYAKYNRHALIAPDPLQFVYRYSKPCDMEIAGFISAGLAYGRVGQIGKSLDDLFLRMGESPFDFVRNFDDEKKAQLSGFKHRFNDADSLADLFVLLKWVLAEFGSIEGYFLAGYDPSDENIVKALARFCDSLISRGKASRGLKYLLAGPTGGSGSKRLNLFLRWMVRSDDVDAGLWKSVDKSKLIVPVDVHMQRLCGILGMHARKNVSLATALEITAGFAEIEPDDPVKYDFSLSRIGIVEHCNGGYRQECEVCELLEYCLKRGLMRDEA